MNINNCTLIVKKTLITNFIRIFFQRNHFCGSFIKLTYLYQHKLYSLPNTLSSKCSTMTWFLFIAPFTPLLTTRSVFKRNFILFIYASALNIRLGCKVLVPLPKKKQREKGATMLRLRFSNMT